MIALLSTLFLTTATAPGSFVDWAQDEPGTRLTWTVEQVGVGGADLDLDDVFAVRGGRDVWERWIRDQREAPGGFEPEGPGAVLVRVERVPEANAGPAGAEQGWPEPSWIQIEADIEQAFQRGGASIFAEDLPKVLDRSWTACYEPKDVDNAKGIVALYPGMFGTPRWIIEQWTQQMVDRDWVVVRSLAHSSRFTEFVSFDVDSARPADDVGLEIARVMGWRLMSALGGVSGAIERLERKHWRLRDKPRVVMGISGGAIVATQLGEGGHWYDAMVLVAGGADLFSISATSNYTPFISAIRFHDRGRPMSEDRREEIAAVYRRRCAFDPYDITGEFGKTEILIIHGEKDRAVPAEYGDLLWERLGRPERWSYPVGHELLALMLPQKFDEIIDWAEEAAGVATPDAQPVRKPQPASGPPE